MTGFTKSKGNPMLKKVPFFQPKFWEVALFENSTGPRRLKIGTHNLDMVLYKSGAGIFDFFPNFENIAR